MFARKQPSPPTRAEDLAAAERDYTESVALLTALERSGTIQGTDLTTLENHRKELARIQSERSATTLPALNSWKMRYDVLDGCGVDAESQTPTVFPHEHARNGPSRHELRFSACDLVKSVGLVELDPRKGGLDANARGSAGDGVSFSQPEERRANSVPRCEAPYVYRRPMLRAVDAIVGRKAKNGQLTLDFRRWQ